MNEDTDARHARGFEIPNTPRVPPPPDMRPEIVVHTQDDDARAWLQVSANAWVRPLMFNPMMGTWTDMMRAEGGQVLVSHVAYTLASASGDFEFRQVGVTQLKGIDGEHPLFEVVWDRERGTESGSGP